MDSTNINTKDNHIPIKMITLIKECLNMIEEDQMSKLCS